MKVKSQRRMQSVFIDERESRANQDKKVIVEKEREGWLIGFHSMRYFSWETSLPWETFFLCAIYLVYSSVVCYANRVL